MAIDAPPHLEPPTPSPSSNGNRGAFVLIAVGLVAVLLVGIVAFVVGGDDGGGSSDPQEVVSYGRPVEPAVPRPSFTLTATDGQPYDFAAETAGQLTFLFFGYTNCPDICPISMATLTAALDELDGVGARVVFVTTDPSRDTPERLQSWLSNFRTDAVGLTGSLADLEAAQQAAGVTVAIADEPDASGNYTVGHSAAMLVYTPDDLGHLNYPAGTTQAQWMDDIPKIAGNEAWEAGSGSGSGVDGLTVSDAYAGPSAEGSAAVYLTVRAPTGVTGSVGLVAGPGPPCSTSPSTATP